MGASLSLFTLVAIVLLAGVIYYLINAAPFIDPKFKQIAMWLILVAVVLYVAFALLGPFPDVRLPHR
jgi:hypothetical protein